MFRKRFVFGILAMIVIVGLMSVGGAVLYRTGFAQGYATSITAEGDVDELTFPGRFYPGYKYHYGYPRGFFPGHLFGLFFGGLFFLMFVSAIFRMIFFRRWGMAYGPHPAAWKHWYHHPDAHKWGTPPWAKDEKVPEDDPEAPDEGEAEQDA